MGTQKGLSPARALHGTAQIQSEDLTNGKWELMSRLFLLSSLELAICSMSPKTYFRGTNVIEHPVTSY